VSGNNGLWIPLAVGVGVWGLVVRSAIHQTRAQRGTRVTAVEKAAFGSLLLGHAAAELVHSLPE